MSMTAIDETAVLLTLIEATTWKVTDPALRASIYRPVYYAIRDADWDIDESIILGIDYVFDRIVEQYDPKMPNEQIWD